ncbi:MAG: hypothetical protein P8Y70_13945 [Candidatus Lokiarchaeota archaeon]
MNWESIKQDFYNYIIENNIIGFFNKPITLKSGRKSYWYVNWRNISSDVYLIDKLADYIIEFVKNLNLNFNCFFGVPEGATKIGIITQYKWALNQNNFGKNNYSLVMGRGKPKDHGKPKDRYFLGIPNGKVIIIEDVTTTGGSLLNSIEKIKKLDSEIVAAIGLTNRNELREDNKTVEEVLQDHGVKYYPMSNALELIPLAYKKIGLSEKIAKEIELYFSQYGTKNIRLL